ncbi:hypothetical protein H4O20_08365 [Aequorivita sp. 609]|uniref:hypothetical protein n=1 Tax=Aequorivita TaxID=153265 RepID=UPI001615C40B|nr:MULTISPECIES: hypothetical protein [Aequorivita]MBB6681454.1 hypothetical protein [Aequorivita sp. 609]
MSLIYPPEKFHLVTDLNKSEIIERFDANVSFNNSFIFRKTHPQKSKEIYEGFRRENGFKILCKSIYGENGSWQPIIFGIINDNTIELELKFPVLSFYIISLFFLLSLINIIVSIYYILIENRFEWFMLWPLIFFLIILPASIKGYNKEKLTAINDLKNIFQ